MNGNVVTPLLWFLVIIGLIPLVLYAMKRLQIGGAATPRSGTPRLVAVLPVSAQNKLVTVEVGKGEERVWLVLGSGPQGLRTLHTMSAQDDASDPTVAQPPAAAFAQLLGRINKGNKPGAGDDRGF